MNLKLINSKDMKTKYKYEKPAVQILFTEHLMQEPDMHFGSGELNGDEEGQVLSKENDFVDEIQLPVHKDIWNDEE